MDVICRNNIWTDYNIFTEQNRLAIGLFFQFCLEKEFHIDTLSYSIIKLFSCCWTVGSLSISKSCSDCFLWLNFFSALSCIHFPTHSLLIFSFILCFSLHSFPNHSLIISSQNSFSSYYPSIFLLILYLFST